MKKIFVLAAALIGISSIYAIDKPSNDVQMGTNAFDMSDLQSAIEEVAYNKHNPLTYSDFVENVFGVDTAHCKVILFKCNRQNHNPDFIAAITVINKKI